MSAVATQIVGSVLFTDLVGFTDFNDARGDAAAVEVLDRQRCLIDTVLVEHPSARLVKELGDGLMVWSADAPSALDVAAEFLAAVGVERDAGDFPLSIRLGIHHGPVTERGDDVVGQTVNIAARISALAGPSELLVSDAVLAACPTADRLDSEPIGPVPVKGVAAPVWLHRLG